MKFTRFTVKLLLAALWSAAAAATTPGQAPSQPHELRLNEPLEQEITSGQTQEYQFTLKAGEFMQVSVEQKGVDVILGLHTPDGKQAAGMNSHNGNKGIETLSYIAVSDAAHTLRINCFDLEDPSQTGKYTITLKAKRPVAPGDAARVDAEREYFALNQLRPQTLEEARTVIRKYEAQLPTWRQLEDDDVAGVIESVINYFREFEARTKREESRPLSLNQPLERELLKSDRHQYKFDLQKGEFIRLLVEQKGIDVTLNVYAEGFDPQAEMDSPNGPEGTEVISFAAPEAGTYTLQIKRLDEKGNPENGKYSITLIVRRAATDDDLRRFEAERQFAAFNQIRLEKIQDIQPKLLKGEALLRVWKKLDYLEGIELLEKVVNDLRDLKNRTDEEARKAASELVELQLGKPLDRQIRKGEAQSFGVTLGAGEFMQVHVEQYINVALSIYDRAGKQLAFMDLVNGPLGSETLSFVAEEAGAYVVKVTCSELLNKQDSGTYSVLLKHKRPPMPADHQRIAAERKIVEVSQTKAQKVADIDPKIAQLEELLMVWRSVGDQDVYNLLEETILYLRKMMPLLQAKAEWEARKEEANKLRAEKVKAEKGLPHLRISVGHSEGVKSLAFTKDEKMIVSADSNSVKLWDIALGKEMMSFPAGESFIEAMVMSPDGSKIASGYQDKTVKLWDIKGEQAVKSFVGHTAMVMSVAFSPDGTIIASASEDRMVKLWDVATGRELKTLAGHTDWLNMVVFSPDGKTVASGGGDEVIRLWDVATGRELRTFVGHTKWLESLSFSPDGKTLASGSYDKTIKLWDVATGDELRTLRGYAGDGQIAFSPDGKVMASAGLKKTIKLWEVATARELKTFPARGRGVNAFTFSRDGKTLAVGGSGVQLWDVATGRELQSMIEHSARIQSGTVAQGLKSLALIEPWSSKIKLWDLATGKGVKSLTGHAKEVNAIVFSPDGSILASGSGDKTVKLWDVATGRELKTFKSHADDVRSIAFSLDGKLIAAGGDDGSVKVWDVAAGNVTLHLKSDGIWITALSFSPDGRKLAAAPHNQEVVIWDVATGKKLHSLGIKTYVTQLAFSPDGKVVVVVSAPDYVGYWDATTGKEIKGNPAIEWQGRLAAPGGKAVTSYIEENKVVLRDLATEHDIVTLLALDENDWAVVDPDGRWDASDGAQKLMYYTLNTTEGIEVIEFSQLKERYYEPNLLPKLLGHDREPLKNVAQFTNVLLPPAVVPVPPKDAGSTVRQIRLKNRNGGIGRVQVFVNGREFIEDARDAKLKANPHWKEYVLSFDLNNAPVIAGRVPEVRVVAWNYDEQAKERYRGYISSRGSEVVYLPAGEKTEPTTLYAIVGGVSDYKGDALDLRFAAKDAEDIYQALQVGGKNLFGVQRVKIRLLSTGDHQGALPPTKENFRQAFAEFAAVAKPNDILFVYFAGHGVTLNFGSDTYYYLTQQATTNDKEALSRDSALLASSSINSEELTQWHKSVKALKQVLILDTCAAGAFGGELKLVEKRDLSSDAKRALDRMRTRVGFHVLMGSAADAASYEASQYGQGLLTYSLLQGMKGPALLPDGQVDVSRLFNYAADEVPNLARYIGGVQRPEIRIPSGGTSFPIGLILTEDDKKLIPLARVKPVILRPNFQNQSLGYDNLKVEVLLRDRLRQASYDISGDTASAKLVFVDTDAMPDAIIPAGNYVVEGDLIKMTVNLLLNDQLKSTVTLEGNRNDLPALIEKMLGAIRIESSKLISNS